MNTIWGAELHYAPDYWPLWLIYAGVVVLLMLVGLVIHALLRRMLAPKTAGGGIGEMRYCLFYYC